MQTNAGGLVNRHTRLQAYKHQSYCKQQQQQQFTVVLVVQSDGSSNMAYGRYDDAELRLDRMVSFHFHPVVVFDLAIPGLFAISPYGSYTQTYQCHCWKGGMRCPIRFQREESLVSTTTTTTAATRQHPPPLYTPSPLPYTAMLLIGRSHSWGQSGEKGEN